MSLVWYLSLGVLNMNRTKEEIYRELITLLDIIEIAYGKDHVFKQIRTRILNIANDVLRLKDV